MKAMDLEGHVESKLSKQAKRVISLYLELTVITKKAIISPAKVQENELTRAMELVDELNKLCKEE